MAHDIQRKKWEQYYATDPLAAPWDTHAVSSQLRSYLCACPACDAAAAVEAASPSAKRRVGAYPPITATDASSRTHIAEPPTSIVLTPGADPSCIRGGRVSSVERGSGTDGGSGPGEAGLHVCALCAPLKPAAQSPSGGPAGGGIRAMELCCGTGASLAFMHRLGFSVVGVELIAAACELAAERLTAEAAAASVAVQSVEAVADTLRRWDVAAAARQAPKPCSQPEPEPPPQTATLTGSGFLPEAALCSPGRGALTASVSGSEPAVSRAGAGACVAQGDLFGVAAWPRGWFDFAYDCQGLHAMPPELRPAYVAVLHHALRSGGLLLLLVGRAEEEDGDRGTEGEPAATAAAAAPAPEVSPVEAAAAAGSGNSVERNGACGQGGSSGEGRSEGAGVRGGAESGSSASARGPALMSRGELRALFGSQEWEWCWCLPTRFDSTPAYARLPRPPPAWCLLLRRC